jgi:hypothetical protein
MIDSIDSYVEWKSKTKASLPGTTCGPRAPTQAGAEAGEQRTGFTKVFRWPVPAEQTPQPAIVEVVGSFNGWRKVPLSYDSPTRTWQLALTNIEGNRTHRYVILVDGKPSYDKTCDGLTTPQTPDETKWGIPTPRGSRIMLLFGQTK